ncbi:MAG: EpsI family protein [candidate division Zixibacteria bacterium]|nr:EpsI family protein [candidate division Zixibacteria bacterium]
MGFGKKEYWALIILTILVGVITIALRYRSVQPDRMADFTNMPLEIDGWIGVQKYFHESVYDVLKSDVTEYRLYTSPDNEELYFFAGYFQNQKYGSQIHSPKNCLPGSGWEIREKKYFDFRTPDGETVRANLFWIAKGSTPQLMIYWFVTRGGILSNEYSLKVDLVANSLKRLPTDACFIRLTIPHKPDQTKDDMINTAEEFLELFYPHIRTSLPF